VTMLRQPRLVQDMLVATAGRAGSKTAIVDEREARTFAELHESALRFARLLQDAGLARGDRVALYLDNTVDCAAAVFGVLLAGGAFTVVNPQTKADKLAYILRDCEAAFLVTEGHSAATAARAVAEAPSVRLVLETASGSDAGTTFDDFRGAVSAAAPDPAAASTIPLDLAGLIYTSGTTGRPKGVMMSHDAFVFAVASVAEYLRLGEDDRILDILPLAFTYGLNQLMLCALLGCTLLLERSFTFPAKTLHRLRDERATVFPAVPTVYVTILGLSHDEPYEDVRVLTNAAAGLPPALHEGIRGVFPNASLYRMYGQTECQRVCYLEPELLDRKPTSVGKAMPGTEALVLDEDGQPVGPGGVGLLHVRGRHVMMGYWREPELTARSLRPGPFPGERMLCTHDYFTADEDGDLYFVDRSDDVIKTRGEKVSSVEVENALHEIAGVRQAAVIGVPDALLGQSVRAYVVLDEGSELDDHAIIRHARTKLENFMVPKDVMIVAELPRTDSGKVRKKSLPHDPTPPAETSALHVGTAVGLSVAEEPSENYPNGLATSGEPGAH
jgi:long-chain acyl-CoA synthetase